MHDVREDDIRLDKHEDIIFKLVIKGKNYFI